MRPAADQVRDHPFVRWLQRNAPDAPFCVIDEDAAREFHSRNPDLQNLSEEDRLRATLAPDHVLFDSHGRCADPALFIRVEVPGTAPSVLTILVVDDSAESFGR